MEITGTLTITGTCRPETGGVNMAAQEIGAKKIGRVILLANAGVGQRGQADGVHNLGRAILQMRGMVLCPGKARPYFAN